MNYKKLFEELAKQHNDLKKVWAEIKAMKIKEMIDTGSIKSQNDIVKVSNKMDELLKIEMMLNFKAIDIENK